MSLSLYEQETIILYNQGESTAEVYTHDPKLVTKLEKLAQKFPEQVIRKNQLTFLVPKRCVQIREPYSEQRRAAARERALASGCRPPKREAAAKTE
ncbi:MAG: immunoglobulin [Oscillospiraceae bacterium]|nr:immunoglobulin [Oscillospiraceae bacterium]